MDRNRARGHEAYSCDVALRKESVDRNPQPHIFLCNLLVSLSARRAWIEITTVLHWYHISKKSLSARRAWIEMFAVVAASLAAVVALRKESVDRNKGTSRTADIQYWSLSARRAWIEIFCGACHQVHAAMSLSARRAWIEIVFDDGGRRDRARRSPQGERG